MTDESQKTKEKWNAIYSNAKIKNQNVSIGLLENAHLYSKEGRALDLACGTGSDSIFLSSLGYSVDAWDISDEIVKKLNHYAVENKLTINAEARDISSNPPNEKSYDLITVAHYLDRSIAPILMRALKPMGILVYQTFTKQVTATYSGPRNLNFRLDENELLSLFSGLKVIIYKEEGSLGDTSTGFRNEALLIGQKVK